MFILQCLVIIIVYLLSKCLQVLSSQLDLSPENLIDGSHYLLAETYISIGFLFFT